MDKYLTSFREMVSLRGLTDHTITSYSAYISAYLQYLSDNGPAAPEDASWQQMRDFILWIQNTRNLSDRYVPLSDNVWEIILRYWYSFLAGSRPKDWLFPQKKKPDKPIDHQRIPSFILAHEKELGWEHRFTCHTFRHAFATYHYEDGTDQLTLKALMGHRSVSSTVIYVHLASNALMASSNPFDRMAGGLYE